LSSLHGRGPTKTAAEAGPLEETVFEPSVSREREMRAGRTKPSRRVGSSSRGTEGSNPSPSSGQSGTNLTSSAWRARPTPRCAQTDCWGTPHRPRKRLRL